MPPAAAIGAGVGVSLLTGVLGANAQEKAAESSLDFEKARFQLLYEQARPFIESAQNAVAVIQRLLGIGGEQFQSLEESPGAAFARSESEKALASRQSARGDRLSGRAAAEATRQGVGFGVSNILQPLFNLAQLGISPLATATQSGTQLGVAGGNAILQGGQAQAGGYNAINNATQGGLSNIIAMNYQNQLLNALKTPQPMTGSYAAGFT